MWDETQDGQPMYHGTIVITVYNFNSGDLRVMVYSIENDTEESILLKIAENKCSLLIGTESKESFWNNVPSKATRVEIAVLYIYEVHSFNRLDSEQMASRIRLSLCL